MKREIFVGNVGIGGHYPVSIQSMTSTSTEDIESTLNQIESLNKEGCDIVRVAIPDKTSLKPFKQILKMSPLPVIADIHFDACLAMQAIEMGANGIRINPGNIGSKDKLKEILKLANQKKIPIRIGVNSGSIEKKYLKSNISKSEAMVNSALDLIKFFEDNDFFLLKISIKSSDVKETIQAYRILDKKCDYPLHLGITEAGTFLMGAVKSAIGIGSLLAEGIGNTIRVSLTDSPVQEVRVAKEILYALSLRGNYVEIISCPTCSRTTVDLVTVVEEVENKIKGLKPNKKIKVAIMGCEVNGPGEAMDADIGLAFSKNQGYIFKDGKMMEKLKPEKASHRLIELIQKLSSS
jgi:(E)-4-hydroxy-3-methylbut-2-enyl-diphosphate synthase